jgi:hypothetical protein
MSTGSDTTGSTGPLSAAEAVSAFESLLSPEEGTEEGEASPTGSADDRLAAELARLKLDTATQEETEEETSDEGEESEESESEEGEEQEEQRAEHAFTVRIDGKDEKVPVSELLAGYSRQADYTRKTQALANDRKAVEQEASRARAERAEYAALLPKLRLAVEQGAGAEPDWAALQADKTPEGQLKFATEAASWTQVRDRKSALLEEERRVANQTAQENAGQMRQLITNEKQQLIAKMPDWKDPVKAKKASDAIEAVLRSVGYGDEDLKIYDHRAMIIADKAAKFDAIMAAQPALKKKLTAAKVVTPGGGVRTPKTAVDSARARFNKSGTVKDAAGFFETLLK